VRTMAGDPKTKRWGDMISDRVDPPIALTLAHLFDQLCATIGEARMKMNLLNRALTIVDLFILKSRIKRSA